MEGDETKFEESVSLDRGKAHDMRRMCGKRCRYLSLLAGDLGAVHVLENACSCLGEEAHRALL